VAREELTVDVIMAILRETPARLGALAAGLSPVQLGTPPRPEAWSINDILAHLRASDDVLGGNIRRILAEDHPAWRRLSPRAWMRKTDYPTWAFAPALTAFTAQRAELLAALEPEPVAAWARTATVTEPGGIVERSARFFGDWLAGHERDHMTQVEEIVAVVAS
jgi:hypothetical protein